MATQIETKQANTKANQMGRFILGGPLGKLWLQYYVKQTLELKLKLNHV